MLSIRRRGAAAAARGDFLFREWTAVAGGDGARGWTSRRRGERPRRPPSLLRLANSAPLTMIATYMRARPAPRRRPLSPIRPRAAGASGRDVGGRRSIAGLLRTAVEGLRRALYPLTWCSGSGTRRFSFSRMDGRRRRRWSSRMDLAPPGRAAAAATFLVAFGEFRPVDHDRYLYARATRAAAATAVAESDLGLLGRAAAT